jgi:hypothetical protein
LFYSIIYGDELFNEFNVVEIDDTIMGTVGRRVFKASGVFGIN